MTRRTRVSELADVATCQRRVYLKAKLGERETSEQAVAKRRGNEIHDRAFKQNRPDDRSQDRRCFIASAVYGPDAWQTQRLRDFRDRELLVRWWGPLGVNLYYKLSPPLARVAERAPWLGRCSRWALDALVRRLPQ